ncbi:MAG: hypothetical protein HRU76_03430 [Phycisphaeraceae bacterium]|nr:MAG: hypothetical protein HRU76_03430 [Phycisphaeraceae bacterium]
MAIHPLPVFEADADPARRDAMTDREIYERLEVPKSLVVKFGAMKMIAEFRYEGGVKPGCGTKLVARTHRGTELVEMLTTTCENSGCSKSITRREMLEYIENSGGRDFPFHTNGLILRVATIDDLNRAGALEAKRPQWVKEIKQLVRERGLDVQMKVVDVEPILGEEILTVYYMSEERVDFRDLVKELAARYGTRIEMRQVGARDEARLVADYERCGQHCCCKNFLKVLKPISMRAAKMQKATLDPLKISGRCGRLMCCLRYEDQTYQQLKKNLPHRKTRVGTPEGPGIVLDSKILAQLVLVQLEHNGEEIAVPVEELSDPETCPRPSEGGARRFARVEPEDPLRGMTEDEVEERVSGSSAGERRGGEERSRRGDDRRRDRGPRDDRGAARPDGGEARGGEPRPSRADRQDRYRQRSQRLEREQPTSPSESSPEDALRSDETVSARQPEVDQPADHRLEDGAAASGEGVQRRRERGRRRRRRGRGERPDGERGMTAGPDSGVGSDRPAAPEGGGDPGVEDGGGSGAGEGRQGGPRRRRRRRRRGGGGRGPDGT